MHLPAVNLRLAELDKREAELKERKDKIIAGLARQHQAKDQAEDGKGIEENPNEVPECMYCPVLTKVQAKTLLRDVINSIRNSPALKNAVEKAKQEGGGQEMVMKYVNPAVMKLQLDVVTKAGFTDGPRGAAQFGMSLNRCMEKHQDQELTEMIVCLQTEATNVVMEVANFSDVSLAESMLEGDKMKKLQK